MPELPGGAACAHDRGVRTQHAGRRDAHHDRELGDLFETGREAREVAQARRLHPAQRNHDAPACRRNRARQESPVSLDGLVLAADLAEAGAISSKQLKQLLDTCFAEGRDFAFVYERDKPQQITDSSAPSRR